MPKSTINDNQLKEDQMKKNESTTTYAELENYKYSLYMQENMPNIYIRNLQGSTVDSDAVSVNTNKEEK